MKKVRVSVGGNVIMADEGENLSEVLIKNGITHMRPCGGRGVCGKCKGIVNGKDELLCRYVLFEDVDVLLSSEGDIYSECGEKIDPHGNGTDIVLDIGTTTLAMALVNKREKKIVNVITANNPQRQFGADVISRIEHCMKNGAFELTRLIRKTVCDMISELGAPKLDTLYVSGNTTMLHIFAGEDPSSMGVAPYKPVFIDKRIFKASDIGIEDVENVYILPSISAFVGADIVSGINLIGIPEKKYRLLVDLGTNAEIVLFSKDKIIATAAAAGPCFEGANISAGMSATNGAIYAYDGKKLETIGDAKPCGICGTGLVDIISVLLKDGTVDESGYMEDDKFEIADNVFITQNDIRQYQLAKSAIYSAILTLMNRNGVELADIERLYISGGFSSKINIENAVSTGLIPNELKACCTSIGNSSLMGTMKFVFDGDELSLITEKAIYNDLSSDAMFSELFIENMGFEGA